VQSSALFVAGRQRLHSTESSRHQASSSHATDRQAVGCRGGVLQCPIAWAPTRQVTHTADCFIAFGWRFAVF